MSISEKLITIAENEPKIYDKGKQDEYDAFWDTFQDYGERKFYSQGFAGYGWTKDNLKPKYPIVTDRVTNRTNGMFAFAEKLTEIMIPLYFYDTTSSETFYYCTKLVKIGDDTGGGLWVTKGRTFNSNFGGCSKLEEIRFLDYNEKGEYVPSEIGNSINFKNCPLSTASIVNIIEHLVNSSTVTLTLKTSAKENMSFPYTSPQSNTTYNSWDELVATKPDCTISLA